jgi:predicted GNAT family acetyltransferase
MSVTVHDHPERSRYEIRDGDEVAGFIDYRLELGSIALVHAETLADFSGRGLGRQLVRETLDDLRERELDVLPECPFVKDFIASNGEYLDLVPGDERRRFGLPE